MRFQKPTSDTNPFRKLVGALGTTAPISRALVLSKLPVVCAVLTGASELV